jgi:thiol:disulfide interchange protein DsbA
MKCLKRGVLVLFLPFFMVATACAEPYKEGEQYKALAQPQATASADKIEVVELFWYGCPHCYRLEPVIGNWLKNKPDDVEFVRMPAIVGPPWELLAKAYYTAEFLGVMDTVHYALFDAIHKDKKKVVDEAAVQAIFEAQGVSAEDFRNTFNSFAVAVKVNNARMMTKRYAISGVPTIIINGKYNTSGSLAGSNENILKVVDYLVEQERQAATAASAR